jgi:hypothetical protein
VFENQDFDGRATGGAAFVCLTSVEWKAEKSEYRLETVKERSGRRTVML